MYDSINDLPFVCQLNLPEAALKVYREAFNRAWRSAAGDGPRHELAQKQAWSAVRSRFERDKETGRWVPKATALAARVAKPKAAKKPASRKHELKLDPR